MTTVLDSLNAALHRALEADERVYLLGEDVLDPYGGAFKVTRGLSTRFPGRVLTTPISEAGITGAAAGMALRGLRPVVEIMFGDFVALAADQVINHIAKFRWMYGGGKAVQDRPRLPLVIRTPMGGRRGYGPTHSQSLEKLYLGIPGLTVLAPCAFGNPGNLLEAAILHWDGPTLFVENKLLYLLPIQELDNPGEFEIQVLQRFSKDGSTQQYEGHGGRHMESQNGQEGGGFEAPAYLVTVNGAPTASITIAAYGYMAELARQAILKLAYEHEIFAELVVPTRLAPFDLGAILESTRRTGRLLTVEEGTLTLGWGAEVASRAAETLGPALQLVHRLGARDLPIPASGPLEAAVLPTTADILQRIRMMG